MSRRKQFKRQRPSSAQADQPGRQVWPFGERPKQLSPTAQLSRFLRGPINTIMESKVSGWHTGVGISWAELPKRPYLILPCWATAFWGSVCSKNQPKVTSRSAENLRKANQCVWQGMPFKACQIIVNSTPTDVKQRQGVPTEWENKNLELLDKKTNTLFAWTQFKANQPSNKASAVGSKDPITKKDKMSILATGKQSLGLFASDLYKMSSPTHSTAEAPFRRWDIYSRVCGGPTFNNLPIQAPLLTILRMIRIEFHS